MYLIPPRTTRLTNRNAQSSWSHGFTRPEKLYSMVHSRKRHHLVHLYLLGVSFALTIRSYSHHPLQPFSLQNHMETIFMQGALQRTTRDYEFSNNYNLKVARFHPLTPLPASGVLGVGFR